MQMNVFVANSARAAPVNTKVAEVSQSDSKTDVTKMTKPRTTNEKDDSFQESLNNSLHVTRENKKVQDNQKDAAEAAAANTAASTVSIDVAQEQISLAMEFASTLTDADLLKTAQQALSNLSQAMQNLQQTNPDAQISIADLMEQINAAFNQTDTDQPEIKIEFQPNSQSTLEMLAQQESGSKVATGLNMDQTVTEKTNKFGPDVVEIDENLNQNANSQDETNINAFQTVSLKSSILEQTNNLDKQTEDINTTMVLDQVSDKIKATLESGKDVVKIQLQPENLGKVDVKIVRGSDGIQLFITSDTLSTTKMMESTLNLLQQSLTDAGVKVGNMSVSYQGQQGQQNNQNQFQKKSSSFFGIDDPDMIFEYNPEGALSALDARA